MTIRDPSDGVIRSSGNGHGIPARSIDRKGAGVMKLTSFGHINIVVDDIDKATQFYQGSLGAVPVQDIPHFKNIGFARAAGFLDNPREVDVSIRFLALPLPTPVFMELMHYHSPQGEDRVHAFKTNDRGGPRHICLRVENVADAFTHLTGCPGVRMINQSPEYRPHQLDSITPEQFRLFDPQLEGNNEEKAKMCRNAGGITFFYFIDPYGVQWEIEQGSEQCAGE
jgi:methylmalonyl-CoA/ethylmalonyl-CoA epimerase